MTETAFSAAAGSTGTGASTGPAAEKTSPGPRSFHDVPGWFYKTDVLLFDWFLSRQNRVGQRGDVLEMGAYLGKSAVLMRTYLREDERFTVCDLFDSDAPDESNDQEMRGSYSSLTRRSFETNFLSFHDELPRVIEAPTSVVPDEVAAGSCRFVHIDASHLYEHVQGDITNARSVLGEDGLIVLDDYRSSHTPGVACATWQAVLDGELKPVCTTNNKFYGTWGDPEPMQDALHDALSERGDCWLQWQQVAGHRLLLVGGRKAKLPELPVSRHASAEEPGAADSAAPSPKPQKSQKSQKPQKSATPGRSAAQRPAARQPAGTAPTPSRGGRSPLRRMAVDVLPPVLTRAIIRARRGK